jgi:hypothetical protein
MRKKMFKKLYPFIFDDEGNVKKELQDGHCVPSFHTEILTEEILGKTPWWDSYSWCGGGHLDYECFFVVEGEKIFELKSNYTWGNGSGDRSSCSDAKTVGEQLSGRNPDFIISVVQQDTDDNNNGETIKSLTVYKKDSQKTKEYLLRILDETYSNLRKELE